MRKRFSALLAAGLMLAAVPALAADEKGGGDSGTPPYGTMGPGMMGPGMGPGMMGPGWGNMGPGMMGQGWGNMGPGMMGRGWIGRGMGGGCNYLPLPTRALTVDDVKKMLTERLEAQGNKRLKLGDVKDGGDDTVLADIVTVDNSLVERLKIDKRTGWMQLTE